MSVRKELVSGVFYTSLSKYAGIIVTLAVSGVLARLIPPEEFGIVTVATVIIAFFAIFSDLGIGPAIIQHKSLSHPDLRNIFSLTVWAGLGISLLFFAAAGPIARFYEATDTQDPELLAKICRILSVNLLFASMNIVPASLILKEKRFRFTAARSLSIQIVGGAAAVTAAYAGAGIYALTINPVFSSFMLFAINFHEHPMRLKLFPRKASLKKVFSFSAYQFCFQFINYFSRNLDKLLMGRYMSLTQLGYYDKSYRLMMLPLQNIAYVISPVMHPVFAHMQDNLRQLATSYLKVVRLLAFIGLPLSAMLCFTSRELILIIFGSQWGPSIPALQILSLSVGIQIVMSTSGSIFQAANATRMLFFSGLFSAVTNITAICTGIFVFGTTQAVAWCICASFLVNFIQCYHALFRLTLKAPWGPFWQSFLSPLLLTAIICVPLELLEWLLPATTPLLASLAAKGAITALIWAAYIQLRGVFDLKGTVMRVLNRKKS